MIRSLVKLDDIAAAEKILEEWESGCSFNDFRIPNLLIAAYCKNGLLEKAKKLINLIIEKGKNPLPRWSIGNILLDLLGGVTNYGQMAMQSIDQGSWVNFNGNIGKTLFSLVSIFFDLLFIVQHYLLYPSKKEKVSPEADGESTAPLIKSSQPLQSKNINFLKMTRHGNQGLVVCMGEMLIEFELTDFSGFLKAPGGAPPNVACAITKHGVYFQYLPFPCSHIVDNCV
ncbi:hypothetical protein IFM89_026386 [Coptis chinensis]|uniref:Uncharacterized protein n=1 Tax=Coptis chinensis TaxID=261450 RepID=A0A835LXC5_9MAGN|nr:hypothetical protein IFM89_026386 [Coptis chinensis]